MSWFRLWDSLWVNRNKIFCKFSAAILSISLSFPQRDIDDSFGFPDELEERQGFNDFQSNQPPRQRPMFNNFPPFTSGPSTTTVTVPTQSTTPAPVTTRSPAFRQCLATQCLTTNEYNPVCGTDNVNYDNERKLDCANFCGPRVDPNWQRKFSFFRILLEVFEKKNFPSSFQLFDNFASVHAIHYNLVVWYSL